LILQLHSNIKYLKIPWDYKLLLNYDYFL